jgi:hypothetical protein
MDKARSTIIILCIVCTGLIVAITIQLISSYQTQKNLESKINSFDTCVLLNNKILESYPARCIADGKSYTEKICVKNTNNQCLVTKEFNSTKGVSVKIYNWTDNKTISSPLVIMGEVPGNWSFEAQFSIEIVDNNKNIILQSPATLQSDWMTDNYVPFTATLDFAVPAGVESGYIVLQKSNPSDLTENADSVEIPVKFE